MTTPSAVTTAVPAVHVGRTAFPLHPSASDKTPVPLPHLSAPSKAPFRFLDGPPYANGAPHLGHVLNKHLKDALCRAAHQLGHAVEWRPGWDCHGLPLEMAVERSGVLRSDRQLFVAAAHAYASSQVRVQSEVFQEQGWCADWNNSWRTDDKNMEAGTLRLLADLADRSLLLVAHTAVPWCTSCQSTLSSAEQENRTTTTSACVMPFCVGGSDQLLVWTSTPWSLPMNQGLVVNPDTVYAPLQHAGSVAWVSEDTAHHWAQTFGADVGAARRLGSYWLGLPYTGPWSSGTVVGHGSVLGDAGTGALHAVSGLAELDTELGRTHGWPLQDHLTPHGLVQSSGQMEANGLDLPSASSKALTALAGQPWYMALTHTSEQPHCWRHHTPLVTRASRQVFLNLDAVRPKALEMVASMEFTPASSRARLLTSVQQRPHWCLSRQRTWGVPMALFLDKTTGQPHSLAGTFMRRAAKQMEQDGVNAWWSTPPQAWLQNDCSVNDVERVDDVLDVWFDSGCVPHLVGNANTVVEGTDQHRGWFQSCVWLSAALDAPPPFQRVVTHGFVMGGEGAKLSKSSGGDAASAASSVPAWPSLPTDVVRVWALSAVMGTDVAWTADTVQSAKAALARWRGVLRFLLANVTPEVTPEAPLPAWDRYWWNALDQGVREALQNVAQGRPHEAVAWATHFADSFSAVALGSWKDRLYCAPPHTEERQRLNRVLQGCLSAWASLMAVLAPRLHRDAQEHGLLPDTLSSKPLALSSTELSEVEQALSWRTALSAPAEVLSAVKVSPMHQCANLPQAKWSWPGQLLADALNVGCVVVSPGSDVSCTASPFLYCPRCRRSTPSMTPDAVCCGVCTERTTQ